MWAWSLSQEGPLQEGMAIHSSILAWRIPWTEEPGRLQSIGSQRVGHDWSNFTHTDTHNSHSNECKVLNKVLAHSLCLWACFCFEISSFVSFLYIPHISDVMRYLSFSVWHILLNMIITSILVWTYGYQEGRVWRRDRLGVWDWHIHTAIFKRNNWHGSILKIKRKLGKKVLPLAFWHSVHLSLLFPSSHHHSGF